MDIVNISLSFQVAYTLKLYSFRIFLHICTFEFCLVWLHLFSICHNFRNHIFLLFHFVRLKYFRFLCLYAQSLNHASIWVLLSFIAIFLWSPFLKSDDFFILLGEQYLRQFFKRAPLKYMLQGSLIFLFHEFQNSR